MKKSGAGKRNSGYVAGLLVLTALGLKHFLDTRTGALASGDTWLMGWYALLAAACLLGVGVLGYLLYREKKTETIFAAAALLFGVLYLLVLPPLSAPDEISHYISAYQLSNHMLGKPANYKTGHVLVRAEDWFLEDVYGDYQCETDGRTLAAVNQGETDSTVLGRTLTEQTYQVIHEMGLGTHADRGDKETETAVSTFPPVVTTPFAYVPQAVGISLARLLGMNSLGLAYLGRLFNLLFYVAVTYLAMRRLPFGKEVLFSVALLPMTLHLTGSMSYDAMILALAYYFTAVCLDLAYKKEKVEKKDIAVLAGVIAVLGPCKMVYAVLMALCFLIPVRKFGSWKRYILSAAVVFGAFAIAMVLVNAQTITIYATETESYVEWAQEAGYSFGQLLSNPSLLLKMFYNTIIWQAEYYHLTMMGAYLGNVDVVLDVPYLVIAMFSLGLLGLAFRKPGEHLNISMGQRVFIWFVCLACAGAILFSMLLAWTPVSSLVITGVQGRYFLPFLPVLLMSMKNDTIVFTKNGDRTILYLMCLADGYVLLRLFSIVSMRL